MACSITIDGVFGLGLGPSVIRVVGTATDCPPDVEGATVLVGISCVSAEGPFIERSAGTDASGNWQALIPVEPRDNCRCDQRIFIRARCASIPDCSAALTADRLQCVECPTITFPSPSDDVTPAPVIVECNPDGSASVTVHFSVQNTTPHFIHVFVNPGPEGSLISGGSIGLTPGNGGFFTAVLQYPTPSSPQPFIQILDVSFNPTGCPPVPIPLDPIEPCEPAECPVITRIDTEVGQCETDPTDGVSKRRVRFTPSVVGPDPVAHNWNFGDGISALVPGPPVPIEHLYAATPIFEPELCVTGPGECATSCRTVPLSAFDTFQPCQCPEIASVAVSIYECERDPADGKLKRKVIFTPAITGPHRRHTRGPLVTVPPIWCRDHLVQPSICMNPSRLPSRNCVSLVPIRHVKTSAIRFRCRSSMHLSRARKGCHRPTTRRRRQFVAPCHFSSPACSHLR
jgi:hypothetical protein